MSSEKKLHIYNKRALFLLRQRIQKRPITVCVFEMVNLFYEERSEWEGRWIQSGITKATNECWRGQMSCRVTGCHVERCHGENTGDEKTEGEEKVSTYCPQRKPEEGHKQRRSVPAWYAVHQEATLIWNNTQYHLKTNSNTVKRYINDHMCIMNRYVVWFTTEKQV